MLDEETYLTADECIEMGFADEIVELKTNSSINQNANMCLYKLVNKLKQKEKEKTIIIDLDEKTADEMVKKISDKLIKGSAKGEPQGLIDKNKQVQKQDTLIVSFFNKFLK